MWRKLEEQGGCDAYGGCEYRRQVRDWLESELSVKEFFAQNFDYEESDCEEEEAVPCTEEKKEEESEEEDDEESDCEEEDGEDYWTCNCGRDHEMDEMCKDCKRWMCGCDPGVHTERTKKCKKCDKECPSKRL